MYSWISLDSFYIDCKTVRSFTYSNTREKLVFQWVAQLWWRFSFSGKRNKHIFWAYPSTLKIAELYFEVLQFIRSAHLFRLTPSSIWHYTTFHYIHHILHRSNAKSCFRITGYIVKIRSQVQTITCANFSLEINPKCIKFTRRVELWIARQHFWTPWLEQTHCMENEKEITAPYPYYQWFLKSQKV